MQQAKSCSSLVVFLALSCGAPLASAHLPIFDDGSAVDAEHALFISDTSLSQVVYHEVSEPAEPLWIAFDAAEGQELYFSPGIPAIERLKEYRPAFALVGPGLPAAALPFDIPADHGAEVYTTSDISAPEFFHEPFSGTDSWIFFKKTTALPQSGRYYLVGYVPSGEPGKFWIAVGKREEFGLSDIAALPQDIERVREFHESSATSAPCFLIPLGVVGLSLGARFIRRRPTLMALAGAIPLTTMISGCGSFLPPLSVVESVDVGRYMGTSYEIASYPNSFQAGCTGTTAEYTLRDDGTVKVVNTCYMGSLDGRVNTIEGTARVADPETSAKLKVSFFPPFEADYWIIDLGPDYEYAVVGDPSRLFLWILSRTPTLDEATYLEILGRLPEKGYDPGKLVRTLQPDQDE